MEFTKIIQLRGVDNQEVGLYGIGDDAAIDPQAAFDTAFEKASSMESAAFIDDNENVDLLEIVDEELAKVGIVRIFVEEVTTDLI